MRDVGKYFHWNKAPLLDECISLSKQIDALEKIIDSTTAERDFAIKQMSVAGNQSLKFIKTLYKLKRTPSKSAGGLIKSVVKGTIGGANGQS